MITCKTKKADEETENIKNIRAGFVYRIKRSQLGGSFAARKGHHPLLPFLIIAVLFLITVLLVTILFVVTIVICLARFFGAAGRLAWVA